MQDAALADLVEVVQVALTPQERLDLAGNQWALLKAGRTAVAQFFAMLHGFRNETDRAVLSAITERLHWMSTNLIEEVARADFERFVGRFFAPQLDQLGWNPRPDESADDRLRRATVIGALGDLASVPAVGVEARRRLERYLQDRASLDPNLASVVAGVAGRLGDAALYERYLERKRTAAADPEEEQRFLFGLTAFEAPALVQRTLELSTTEEVRPQDRAHVLARLLGQRAARLAAWNFVRDRWADVVGPMDPMLQQNVVRGLAQLTPEPVASEVRAFLTPRGTDETRETIAQAVEQLAIDAAACRRLAPEVTAALQKLA